MKCFLKGFIVACLSLNITSAYAATVVVNPGDSLTISETVENETGIAFQNYGNLTISGTAQVINNVGNRRGAINNGSNATLIIESGARFVNNSATNGYGGNIFGNGTMNIDGAHFEDNSVSNSASVGDSAGGAIYYTKKQETTPVLTLTNSNFVNNSAEYSGGAAWIGGQATLTGNTFSGNHQLGGYATNPDDQGGAALYFGSDGKAKIINNTFDSNISINNGGAISMRTIAGAGGDTNARAKLDIADSAFSSNEAGTDGGAIYNTFYNNNNGDGYVSISNTTFTDNTADRNGGAIYNTSEGKITLDNVTFSGNTANAGGAIYNAGNGVINFYGDNTFSANIANGVANDIYNEGTINFNSGTISLEGGIAGTASSSVIFASGVKLIAPVVAAATNPIIQTGTLAGDISLVLAAGSDGQMYFEADDLSAFSIGQNTLFDITDEGSGRYTIAAKSSSDIADGLGVSGNALDAVSGVISGTSTNEIFNSVANGISYLLQSSDATQVAEGVSAAQALAPTAAPAITAITVQHHTQVLGAVGSRFSGAPAGNVSGMASGDVDFNNSAIWMQGLYNVAILDGENGFDSYSGGAAVGVETNIYKDILLGLGFTYTNSHVNPTDREIDVDSYSPFIYGEYKPSAWYVNGVISGTFGSYKETKKVIGSNIEADYDLNSLALAAMTGYEFSIKDYSLSPEVGLRYINVNQGASKDSAGNQTKSSKLDIFTGVLGMKLSKAFGSFIPEIGLAATYDFQQANALSTMTMANGSVVNVDGTELDRFGGEAIANVSKSINDNWNVELGYVGKFRKDYQDHTGVLNVKYLF